MFNYSLIDHVVVIIGYHRDENTEQVFSFL